MLKKSLSILVQMIVSAIAAVAALLICLALFDTPGVDTFSAEHVKRVRYPSMTHIWRDEDFSRYRSNSLGLLGGDPAPQTDSQVFRIALFGDSFVEALQVPEDKHFATLLQQMLTERGLSKSRVEVWNFGFSGDNTGNAYARWRYRPPGYRFDLVIFTFNDGDLVENTPEDAPASDGAFLVSNDGQRFVLDESRVGRATGEREKQLKRTFGQFFYSVYRVKNRSLEWLAARRSKFDGTLALLTGSSGASAADAAKSRASSPRDALALASESVGQLRFVRAELQSEGVPTLLAGIPSPRIAIKGYQDEDPLRRAAYLEVSRRLTAANEPFIDLLPAVESLQLNGNDLYSDWDVGGHFNRAGHVLIAEQITEAVLRMPRVEPGSHAVQ